MHPSSRDCDELSKEILGKVSNGRDASQSVIEYSRSLHNIDVPNAGLKVSERACPSTTANACASPPTLCLMHDKQFQFEELMRKAPTDSQDRQTLLLRQVR